VVTFRLPLTFDVPRSRALASVKATLRPLVTMTVLKSFDAFVSVMSLPVPATSVVVPATVRAPLCVRAPLVVTLSVPDTVEVPRSSPLASTKFTLLALVTVTELKCLARVVEAI